MNPNSRPQIIPGDNAYDDEISLIDLWLVLVRRKLIILSVFFLCLVLGIVYAFTRPDRYEYRTGIELARVTDFDTIDESVIGKKAGKRSPNTLSGAINLLMPIEQNIDLLENVIIPEEQRALFGEVTRGPRIKVENKEGTYNITLSTVSKPEEADRVQQLHKAVAASFSKIQDQELKKILGIQINPLHARAEILRGQIQAFEAEIERLAEYNLDNSVNREFIIAQQAGELRRELAQTRLALADAESKVKAILDANQGSRLLYLAVQSKSLVGPGKQLIVSLSVVLGAMLGIMGAFIAEFFRKVVEASQQAKEEIHVKDL